MDRRDAVCQMPSAGRLPGLGSDLLRNNPIPLPNNTR